MAKKSPVTGSLQLSRDRKLVRRMLAGDDCAQREFMEEYFPRLYRYVRLRIRNESEVEDIVQAALIQAARRLETWRGEARLLTWLVQICRHELGRAFQRQNRDARQVSLDDELLEATVASIELEGDHSPEREGERLELVRLVQFALDQLPEHYARALELKYVEGCGSREIGQVLQISDEATQSLLARARRAFRDVCDESLRMVFTGEIND